MKIIKYCKEEHNLIKGCLTLQLGTPMYYRELDPALYQIADHLEGTYYMDGVTDLVSDTTYKDCKATVPNCYIFCVSTEELEPNTIDKSYNSKYVIRNTTAFSRQVARLLYQQLNFTDFTQECQYLISETGSFSAKDFLIIDGWAPINYKSTSKLTTSMNSKVHQDLANHYRNVIFTKDEKFVGDKELRFAFVVYNLKLGKVLSVKQEPKLINTNNSLSKYLCEC